MVAVVQDIQHLYTLAKDAYTRETPKEREIELSELFRERPCHYEPDVWRTECEHDEWYVVPSLEFRPHIEGILTL